MNHEPEPDSVPVVRRLSPLAMASIATSVLPVGSLLAPILGIAALLQLRRRPDLRGAGVAWGGIVIGTAASALMVGGAYWMYRSLQQLADRPGTALAAAWAGEAELFRAQMAAPANEVTAPRLEAWVAPLKARLGTFAGATMGTAPPPAPPEPLPEREMRAAYVCRFGAEGGPREIPTVVVFERPLATESVAAIRIRRFEFELPDGARIVFPPDEQRDAPSDGRTAGDEPRR